MNHTTLLPMSSEPHDGVGPLALRPYQCNALTAIEAATLRGVRHVCAMVLLEGTLRTRQKRDAQLPLRVSGFALPPPLAPTLTGSSN